VYTKFQFNPARIYGFTEFAAVCSKYAAAMLHIAAAWGLNNF